MDRVRGCGELGNRGRPGRHPQGERPHGQRADPDRQHACEQLCVLCGPGRAAEAHRRLPGRHAHPVPAGPRREDGHCQDRAGADGEHNVQLTHIIQGRLTTLKKK